MGYNIYFGNLPEWATADDIRSWLDSSDLVADAIRVIRDFETQESKGYAFIEAPNEEEMESIIGRFNRAPIDGKLLRAKAAHPKGEKTRATPSRRPRRRRDEADGGGGGGQAAGAGAGSGNGTAKGKQDSVGTLGEALQKAL